MFSFSFSCCCCVVVIQLLFSLDYGLCLMPHKINPYEQVFKMLLREPPINKINNNRDNDEIKEEWLEQPLDHFDANNMKTWKMRYFANDKFYRNGAPIFVFVGGEWEISPHLLQSGHFYDMAKQQEGLMFYTEHRFYGKSWPKSNASIDNLKYLNVLQSLADLKNFLELKKASTKVLQNSKVVLVGGSYSGSMVAWFMKLYPELADVAWASSAPLMAKMDFSEYMILTMKAFYQKGGFTCGLKLEKAFSGLSKMMQDNMLASSALKRLKICRSFDSKKALNRQAFFNGLGNYFASLVQSHSSVIPQFCKSFNNLDANPTEALIKYLAEFFLTTEQVKIREEADQKEEEEEEGYCLDFSYDGMKLIFSNENELRTGTRPWFFQTCHEFGWFTTTAFTTNTSTSFAAPLAFGGLVPLFYFQQLCQDTFENNNNNLSENLGHGKETSLTLQQMHNRALTINKLFGGFSNASKRVIFTHGLLDPWRAAGLQSGQNVLLIKDYSHVEDMGSINFSDTVEMNVVKLKVAAFINKYLRYH